ncbi:MAG: hypothetical protein WCL02_02280 [bacterium]
MLLLSLLLLLTGCTSKSNFLVAFDTFTINIYDNNKKYTMLPLDNTLSAMKSIQKLQEQKSDGDTGFINSLLIIKTSIAS